MDSQVSKREKYMKKILSDYKALRGNPKDSCGKPFWDTIVITASDEEQMKAFNLQLSHKKLRNELPTGLEIHVVTDPPGTRIGNGGSTLHSLEFLKHIHGDNLQMMKILMIHAGGWSQRLPSSSLLGKIFSILPYGEPPYQMLDLKLALYWPFVERIEPGVFLVCADDFLLFDLESIEDWKIPAKGFTALAHPSSIEVGRTHGVFVVEDVKTVNTLDNVVVRRCLEVLQKPSDERMKSRGAVLEGTHHKFADNIELKGEVVYTDSCFYFGVDVIEKLLQLKTSLGQLDCEIDAYGDFLQAVGSQASNNYIQNMSNISQLTPNLLSARQAVYQSIKNCDIHALILNASAFVHIGTAKELLHHFCLDAQFKSQMSFKNQQFNVWCTNETNDDKEGQVSDSSCIVHSVINECSHINTSSFIEYCKFEKPIEISEKCIISNCEICVSKSSLKELYIPPYIFLHTVPVLIKPKSTKYVTVFFHIEDNLKTNYSMENIESLPFLGSTLGHYLKSQSLKISDVVDDNDLSCINLWRLKLYPAMDSMSSSFEETVTILNNQPVTSKAQKLSRVLFSFSDLLKLKDIKTMLDYRQSLFGQISASRKV